MSSDLIPRRAALLGLLAAASGCGFAPVHRDGASLQGQIAFDTPESVAGFRMREQLEKRLGTAQNPRFVLRVRPSGGNRAGAITSDGDTVRFNFVGNATWRLRDLRNNAEIESGKVESFTSYGATGSTVATQAAEKDANARLSITLADMIVSRLLILSPRLAQ